MSYTWADAEQTILKYEDGDLSRFIPADPACSYYAEYLASGETAADYVEPPAPPPLTTEEKITRLLTNYDLTRDELRSLL